MNEINLQKDFEEIIFLITESRNKSFRAVNNELITLYWKIGKYISHRVKEAGWGKRVVQQLASYIKEYYQDLKGFTASNLWRMKQFYETYGEDKKLATLWRELSWSHNRIIFSRCKSETERKFYLRLSLKEGLSTRELDRQINSSIFERTILAGNKFPNLVKNLPRKAHAIFRDRYVFEFLDIPEQHSEQTLRRALLAHLKKFILEIGRDFSFIGEEYRLQVGNRDFSIDLLFFPRELRCLVAFELKIDQFKPDYLGRMEFYLEALDRDIKKPHENPSIGVLLCRDKDEEVVKYALSRTISPTVIAQYESRLIPKQLLKQKLHEFYQLEQKNSDE